MEHNRIYVVDGGAAAQLMDQIKAGREERFERLKAFVAKWGADEYMASEHGNTRSISGLMWPKGKDIPEGWRRSEVYDCDRIVIVPHRGKKAGKEVAKELSATNKAEFPRAEDFFDGETWVVTGRAMYTPAYGSIGGMDVVVIHKESKAKPIDGLREIPLSEYYAAKEAHEAAAAV